MNRYESIKKIKNADLKNKYETVTYPKFERKETDIYIISKETDRLDLLANQYYSDPRFWFVIARANNLGKGTLNVPAGIQLRIPQNITDIFGELSRARKER